MLIQDVPAIAAHNAPDGAAFHFEGRTMAYAQLRDHCHLLSRALASLAPAGSRVAIMSGNSLEFVASCFAIPGAGQIMVPLNIRLSERELAEQLEDAEPSVVLVEPVYVPVLAPLVKAQSVRTGKRIELIVIGHGVPGYPRYDDLVDEAELISPKTVPRGTEDDPAWILFTSGTTGRAKGAVLTHRNLMTGTQTMMMSSDAGRSEVVLFQFPMFHIAAYTLIWFLLRGYTVVVVRSFEARICLQAIEQHRVTMMSIAPTMLAMLLENPALADHDTSSLRLLTYGSSAMPAEVIRRAMARWPAIGFGTAFGMTELAGNALYHDRQAHVRAVQDAPHLIASCGKPMALSCVRLIDDAGQDVPRGEMGELAVKGEQVFSGYWRNDEANRSAFRDGWFLTGDMGRRDADGYFYIVDRKKDMIISGGENVYSREIEKVLYQFPGVAEVAVIGMPDVKWGEQVTAVLRLSQAATPEFIDELESFCRTRMAGFKRPRRWVIVQALPQTPAGKIKKAELRKLLVEGKLDSLLDSQRAQPKAV